MLHQTPVRGQDGNDGDIEMPTSPLQRLASTLLEGEGGDTPNSKQNVVGRVSPTIDSLALPLALSVSAGSFTSEHPRGTSPLVDQHALVLPEVLKGHHRVAQQDKTAAAAAALVAVGAEKREAGETDVISATAMPQSHGTATHAMQPEESSPEWGTTPGRHSSNSAETYNGMVYGASPYAGCSPGEAFSKRGAIPSPSREGIAGLSYVAKQRLDDPMCFDCGACGEQSSGSFCHNCGARCIMLNPSVQGAALSPSRSQQRNRR